MTESTHDDFNIAAWHEQLLTLALQKHTADPTFRFNLRTGDVTGKDRLQRGYWFTGNERYLFFAPFRPHDPNNKTRTIGFVVRPRGNGLQKCSLEIVFGSVSDERLIKAHERIASELAGLQKLGPTRFRLWYSGKQLDAAFEEFVARDYPRIRNIAEETGLSSDFLITESDFATMLRRIEHLRSIRPLSSPDGAQLLPANTSPVPQTLVNETSGRPQNVIYYGPPGTGKTYRLQGLFDQYTDRGDDVDHETWLIDLLSEFGWRPVIAAAMAERGGECRVPDIREHELPRMKARQRGRTTDILQTIWGYLGEHSEPGTGSESAIRRQPHIFVKGQGSAWRLSSDWADLDPEASELLKRYRAGPMASGEVRRYRMVTFHPAYSYEDFIRGIRPVMNDGVATFQAVDGIFKRICDEARSNPSKRYALFIDEINRGNIANIFGELITLIEPNKRTSYDTQGRCVAGIEVTLPGGDGQADLFGVPSNLDIYGSMNTADRSIALLDIALRRRFQFEEIEPCYDLLNRYVEGVHIGRLLGRINDRLEYLLDREHRIGHANFLQIQTLIDLRRVFAREVIPLLQEYFYDDLSKVAAVLSAPDAVRPFLVRESVNAGALFQGSFGELLEKTRSRFRITAESSWSAGSFIGIYDADQVDAAAQSAAD